MAEHLLALAGAVGGTVIGDGTVVIDDVIHDHRDARAGALFVARRGLTTDGHRFVKDAATLCEAVCVEEIAEVDIPQLVVADTTAALGLLASSVHGAPFTKLRAVGVTGTNGKTTVTQLIASIVHSANKVPAVAGTLGWSVGAFHHELARTSPEASDLHRIAGEMVRNGADIAAFEVSSHALAMHRTTGAHFSVATFTNLSQDHLDFHDDMESYFEAKASLFTSVHSDRAVIWVDDPAGRRLAAETELDVTTVGTDGDVGVSAIETGTGGSSFVLSTPAGERQITMPLPGLFNVNNGALAAASVLALGVDLDDVVAGLESAPSIPGRFEKIDLAAPYTVIVDYAHTPDGITNAISAGRKIADARVLVVLGAGGDRDPAKRPLMGKAASAADAIFVTNDNPRSEDPAVIASQVVEGIGDPDLVTVELDRRLAIRGALAAARPGDVVLILGKGHERGQQFGDRTEPFSDAEVVAEEVVT